MIDVERAPRFKVLFFAGVAAAFPGENAGGGVIDGRACLSVVAVVPRQDGLICRGGEGLHAVHEPDVGLFQCRGKPDVADVKAAGHGTRGIRAGCSAAKLSVRADIPLFQRDALSLHNIGGRMNEKIGLGCRVVGGGVAPVAAVVEAAAGERGEPGTLGVDALNLLCVARRAVFLSACPAAGGQCAGGDIPFDNGGAGGGRDGFCQVRESIFFCIRQFVSHLRVMERAFPGKMFGRSRRQQEQGL